jgi:hypothetical protein
MLVALAYTNMLVRLCEPKRAVCKSLTCVICKQEGYSSQRLADGTFRLTEPHEHYTFRLTEPHELTTDIYNNQK